MMLVDDRVGSRDLLTPLRQTRLPVELARLPFADVAFVGKGARNQPVNIGVELKNLGDLCSSLRTGRLSGHQVPGLMQAYDYRWLVVEGVYGCSPSGVLTTVQRGGSSRPLHGRMTLDEVEGRLLTLALETGLHIRHTSARWQTVRFIARLYRWWTDGQQAHTSHLTPHTLPTLLPLSRFRQVVAQLPGVGLKASKAAEAKFHTVARAMTATVDEWASLETGGRRLGTKTASAIVAFCQRGA